MYKFFTHLRTRQCIALLCSMFLLIVVLDEMAKADAQTPELPRTTKAARVLMAEIEQVVAPVTQRLLGEIVPVKRTSIASQINGRVVEVLPAFKKGLHLEAGTALLKIETLPYQMALLQAKSALAEANVELARLKAQEVSDGLVVELAVARVDAATAKVSYAQMQLDATTIRMPISGEIVQIKTHIGEYLSEGAEAAVVLPNKSREIKVGMSEVELSWLSRGLVGQTVQLVSLSGNHHGHATVTGISQFTENLQRFLYLQLEEGQQDLLYGQHVYVGLPVVVNETLHSLPESVLTPKGEVWWLGSDSSIYRYPMTRYFLANQRVYFPKAQSKGQQAVAFPNSSLSQGMYVDVQLMQEKGDRE